MEVVVAAGADVTLAQVLDERIEALVVGDDVEETQRVALHRAAEVVGEGEIEGVLAGLGEAHELHGAGVVEQLFDERGVELLLAGAEQQREAGGFVTEDRGGSISWTFSKSTKTWLVGRGRVIVAASLGERIAEYEPGLPCWLDGLVFEPLKGFANGEALEVSSG